MPNLQRRLARITRGSGWSEAWRMRALLAIALLLTAPGISLAEGGIERTPAPDGVSLYFITPLDGAKVKSPVTVRFGLSGMGVAPAGVEMAATGHHHLLIDTDVPDTSLPVPSDDHHRHFGAGQTEARIDLAPGKHTLQLLLGDHRHVPHLPPVVSPPIEITVE